MSGRCLIPLLAVIAVAAPAAEPIHHYRGPRRDPPALEPVLRQVTAGQDAFPEEKRAEELEARLAELGQALRAGGAARAATFLDPGFRGGKLRPQETVAVAEGQALRIARGSVFERDPVLPREGFVSDLAGFLDGLGDLVTTELLVTGIEGGAHDAVTDVRYDLVGADRSLGRAERVGQWKMRWRREGEGPWLLLEWTALADVRSRAPRPLFREVTGDALGGGEAGRRQLAHGLDHWIARLDGALLDRKSVV